MHFRKYTKGESISFIYDISGLEQFLPGRVSKGLFITNYLFVCLALCYTFLL